MCHPPPVVPACIGQDDRTSNDDDNITDIVALKGHGPRSLSVKESLQARHCLGMK